MLDQGEQENSPTSQQQYEIQVAMAEPVLFATSSYPDIMSLQEAMKALDHKNFLLAMDKEIQGHEQGKHWELVGTQWHENFGHSLIYGKKKEDRNVGNL